MDKERDYRYDLLRTISCLCVIFIHTLGYLLDFPKNTTVFLIGNIIQTIVRIGLPMFVIISGALILNSKEEQISKFYFKRFVKIIIPFIIYYLIYIFIDNNYDLATFYPRNLIHYLKVILIGPTHVHLWFVYMILGLYLCAPFLKKMCQNLSSKDIDNLFILIIIISIIKDFIPYLGISIGINNIPFYGWASYFLLGYILTNSSFISKHNKLFYILGIISFIFTIIDVRYNILGLKNIYDLAPTMMFMNIGAFTLVMHNKIKFNNLSKKMLNFTSKYSWEVYLVHCIVISIINNIKNTYHILIVNKIITHLIANILIIIISYILAFIIHNLIIKYIQKLIYKIDILTFNIMKKNNGGKKYV